MTISTWRSLLLRMKIVLGITFLSGSVVCCGAVHGTRNRYDFSDTATSTHLRGRLLSSSTVATSDCSAIRLAPYPAELQLLYDSSVEFKSGRAVSLKELARALANHVALHLDMCDNLGRPVYKVKLDSQHRFSKNGKHPFPLCVHDFVSIRLFAHLVLHTSSLQSRG